MRQLLRRPPAKIVHFAAAVLVAREIADAEVLPAQEQQAAVFLA